MRRGSVNRFRARSVGDRAGRALSISTVVGVVLAFAAGAHAADGTGLWFDDPDDIFRDGSEAQLHLRGVAQFLDPLADATLTVTLSDGRSAEGVAGADGRFGFRVESFDPEAILTLRARGVETQAHLEFASWLGDLAFLHETAGDVAALAEAEVPALRVNPHQTALYVGIRDLPATTLSPSGRSFALQAGGWSPVDVFSNRGPLIAMMSAGDLPLPAGAETTLQAASEEALVAAATAAAAELPSEGCPNDASCVAADRITNDPTQVAVLAEPPFDTTLQVYFPLAIGSSARGFRLHLSGDGNGTLGYGASPVSPVEWTTTETPNVFRIERADGQPLAVSSFSGFHSSCGCQVEQQLVDLALRVMFATGPGNGIMLGYTSESERRFPANPEIPTEPAAVAVPTFHFAVLQDDVPNAAFDDPSGHTLILPRCGMPDCSPFETPGSVSALGEVSEPHRFEPGGTGTTLRLGDSFTWVQDELGRLTIDYASGAVARYLITTHDRANGTVAVTQDSGTGSVFALSSEYAIADGSGGFVEADLVDHDFVSVIACDMPFASATSFCRPEDEFVTRFNADGTGTAGGGTLTWSLDPQGRLVYTRFIGDDVFQIRTWEKITSDAGNLYVLENVSASFPPEGTEPSFAPTARFQRFRRR